MAPWEVEVDAGVAMFGELALRARLGGTWIKDATQDAYAYEGPGVSFLMTVSAGISYSKLIWMLNEKANMDCAVKYLPPLAPVSPHELISLHDEGDLQELVRVYHEAKVKGGGRIDIFLEEVEDPYVFEGNFVEGLQGSDASSRCTMGEDEWSLWGPPDDEEAVAGPDTPLLNSRHKEPAPSELGSCAAGISVMEVGKPGVHAQTLHANLVKWLPGEADQQTTEEPEDTADDSFSELAAARFLPAGLFDDCTPPAANPVASQTQGTGCLNLPSHISIFGGSRAEDPNEEWLLEEQERNALAVVKMALGSLDEAGNVGGACVDGGSTAAAQACGAAVAREGSDEPGLAGAGTKPVVLGLGLDHPSFLHMRHAAGELRQHTAARQAGHRAHQLWEAAGSHVQQSQHGTASRMMAPLEGCHEGKYWGPGVPIKVQPWSPPAAESAAAPVAAGLFNPLRGPQQWMSPMGMQWPMGKGLAPTLADADRCMPAQEPQAMHEHQLDQLQPVVRGPTCAPARGGQPALLQPAGAGFSAVPASRGLYGTGGGVRAGIEQPEEQRNKKALGGACAQDRRPFFVEPQSQSPRGAQAPLLSVRKGVAPVKGLAHNGAHRILQSSVKHEKALGSGSFGDVVLCKVRVFGQVAIKFLKVGKASHQQEFWSEADMLARLNHPNVLRFFGYVVDDECSNVVGIATEYADQQSLAELLNDLREWKPGVSPHMSLQQRARFAVAAVRGLQYIHSQDIIHFDLKPENLLLVGETRARACLKVADLGLSRQKLDRSRAVSVGSAMRGTLPYMSPDIIHCPGAVTAATDVWSMGVILHELFTLQAPYGKNSAGSIHRALNRRDDMVQKLDAEGALFQCHCGAQQRGYAQVPDARGYMPFGGSELCQGECRVWRQLILGCLQLDPADRIRLDDMVEMLERLYPQF